MNTNITTNLHMTADVWNALVDMMNVGQLDDFGGAGQVLLMLNAFKRMENLFKTINQALKAKGGVA